jgi:predicted nuclease of predicted toxin-antitoxin system
LKFKLDENLGKQSLEVLRNAGFDISSVPEQKLCGVTDKRLIEICRIEGRCLITLDLEFGNPLVYNPAEYSGIIVLRLRREPSLPDLLETVHTLATALNQKDLSGKLWIVQKDRIREYQPEDYINPEKR